MARIASKSALRRPPAHRWVQSAQEIGGALRMRGGTEDSALVILEDGEPVGNIGGVILAGHKGQFEVSAQEGRTQLGDKFFLGIAFVAPFLAPEFTVEG